MRSVCFLLAFFVGSGGETTKPARWDFEDTSVGKTPAGWKATQTGKGKGSIWKIVEDKTAPKGPLVLAQTAESPASMFNLCVVPESSFQDGEIRVAFKAVGGEIDQGGGPVWRYQDPNNYYIARYNPLEKNFRLYKVIAGKRMQLDSKGELNIPAGEWHTIKIRHVGQQIECLLDDVKHLAAKDDAIAKAGKVGLWTKADAQTYFDDLRLEGK